MAYNMGKYQYSDKEMKNRYLKLKPKLFLSKGIDILLTHSPAYGINDQEDIHHSGFKVFNTILDKYEPKYFIHGNVHLNYGKGIKRVDTYKNTTIINAFERYTLEI